MLKAKSIATLALLNWMAVLLLPVSAQAQATINVPRDQPTIQAGINAANGGDTVLVAPGMYVENIDFLGKAITVTSSGGAANTVIDGGATGPVVTFQTVETRASVLSGMTIQHAGGYGVNVAAVGIAGVVISNSSPTILNNIITQNQCWNVEVLYGAPLVQGNTISSTQSPANGCGPGSGAGIFIGGNLNGDTNANDGTSPVIQGNTIENNTIPESLNVSSGATNLDGSNGGAGIAVLDGSPLIENNILRNNASPGGNGGAINVAGGYGIAIVQNLIYGNSAGCGGGAISFTNMDPVSGPYLLVANNTLVDNTSGTAGPYANCSDISQIYGSDYGLSEPDVIFANNIVSSIASDAPAIGCFNFASAPSEEFQSIFDHNLLYNGGGNTFGPTCVDVSAKYGNLSAAPQFANAASGDYHLLESSPGVDAGNNSALGNLFELSGTTLATDFDGNPRVQDATGSSYPAIDAGTYERAGAENGGTTTIVLTASFYGKDMTLIGKFASGLGVPTGSATFFLDGQSLGTAEIASDGSAILETGQPAAGVYSLYVDYAGHGTFTPARSVIIIISVTGAPASNKFSTTLEFGTPVNPQAYGKNVPFTVIGSSADPNPAFVPSPVTLTLNGAVIASLALNNYGIAHFTTGTLPVGYDVITASYAGDATHQAATTSFTEEIDGIAATTILACTPATIPVGKTALLTAQVSAATGTPTGAIIFSDGSTTLAEVELANAASPQVNTATASFTYMGQAAGQHILTAAYAATGAYEASAPPTPPSGSPPQNECLETVVGRTSTSVLTVNQTAGAFLSVFDLTATVSPASSPGLGTPTGMVSFFDGASALGVANLAGGIAKLSTMALPIGTNPLTCMYSGDSNYQSSNCNTVPVTVTSAQPTLTITPSANPAPALTQVTFNLNLTASGQPAPMSPIVLFSIAGETVPLTLVKGHAEYVTSSLVPGSYPVSATFAGTASLLSATAAIVETVVASSSATALSVTPNPGYVGQPITLAAVVTADGTLVPIDATVTFYDGTIALGTGTLDQTRSATLTTSSLSAGTHALTASYPGTNVFSGSTSPVINETILASSFTIALSPTTVTVPADQAATIAIQLASVGGFAGPLTLSYGSLPVNASATLLPPTVTLMAGGTGSSTLTLNTASPNPVSASRAIPRSAGWTAVFAAALVLILPLNGRMKAGLPGGRARLFLWLAITAVLLQAVTGCGNRFYTLPGVAPGTYTIPVTATDTHQNRQTAMLTLVVPPK